jgi:ABC-type multidrug transport system ATPase subunit
MNSTNIALEAVGVGKRYRRGWALRDCSFSLPAETVVALIGPNGAGKSTLMAMATGILAPTTSVIKVLGSPIRPAGRTLNWHSFSGTGRCIDGSRSRRCCISVGP